MELEYAFSISPMYPRPHIVERWSPHGRWRPPKALGHNLSLPPAHFHFNGSTTSNVDALPRAVQLHRTYSIYHDRAIFWTVDYDATQEQVGDGNENNPSEDTPEESRAQYGFSTQSTTSSDTGESSDEEGHGEEQPQEEKDDWAPMKFDHRESDLLSYAGRHQPFPRLRVRRSSQEWARKLLPDTCSARRTTNDPGQGGLIGELPLLIGLMAMASPPGELAAGLCHAISSPWRAPQHEREAGWEDKRGLIVTTYACPPHSSISDLVNYERGQYGNILP